jgi:putative transposase
VPGERINHKRVQRVWRANRLQQPTRRRRRRRPVGAVLPTYASRPNEVWTYDFIHDQCADGTRLKLLTVIDEFTAESLEITVERTMTAEQVQQVLARLFAKRGAPGYLRSDNGPEFIAQALVSWLQTQGVETRYLEPGSPWQNGRHESFHDKFRRECLNAEWFKNRQEARVVIEHWRQEYNQERPHSRLGYLTPSAFRAQWEAQPPCAAPSLGLSLGGPPEVPARERPSATLGPSVRSPASALGSLPSVALSSAQAEFSLPNPGGGF